MVINELYLYSLSFYIQGYLQSMLSTHPIKKISNLIKLLIFGIFKYTTDEIFKFLNENVRIEENSP